MLSPGAPGSKHLAIECGNPLVRSQFPRQARDDDGLGSVVALSDVNNVLVERYAYDIFGRPTIRDANGAEIGETAVGNPFLFTGRRYDGETALYYYRARYYDYYAGRFLQPDPTGYVDGLNLYTYVGNNPIGFVDPLGLCKENAEQSLEVAAAAGLIPPGEKKPFFDWLEGEKRAPQIGRRPKDHYGPEGLREKYQEWKELGKPRGSKTKAKKPWKKTVSDAVQSVGAAVVGGVTAVSQTVVAAGEWAYENPGKATVVVVGGAIIVFDVVTIPSGEGSVGYAMIRIAVP